MGNTGLDEICCCSDYEELPGYGTMESSTPCWWTSVTESSRGNFDTIEGLQVVKELLHQNRGSEEILETFLKKHLCSLRNEGFVERINDVLSALTAPLSTIWWNACNTMEGVHERTKTALELAGQPDHVIKSQCPITELKDPLLTRAYEAIKVESNWIGTYEIHGKEFHLSLDIVARRERLLIAVQSITVLDIVQCAEVQIKLDVVDSQVLLSFSDHETSYEGLYDFERCRIVGRSIQIKGLDKGAEGTFEVFNYTYKTL